LAKKLNILPDRKEMETDIEEIEDIINVPQPIKQSGIIYWLILRNGKVS